MKPKAKHAIVLVIALAGIALLSWWLRREAPLDRKRFDEAGRFLGDRDRVDR